MSFNHPHWPYMGILPFGWREYDPTRDYCGPNHMWVSRFLSSHILGANCNRAYWAHDQRYRLGTTKRDKRIADKCMLKDQLLAINAQKGKWNPLRYLAWVVAYRRYHFVKWCGNRAFKTE